MLAKVRKGIARMITRTREALRIRRDAIRARHAKRIKRVTTRSRWYWMGALTMALVGFGLDEYLAAVQPAWEMTPKFFFYNLLNGSERAGLPSDTAVVLVTDQEYWTGKKSGWDLAHRSPLKKDYVGALVEKLCAADARVVALDINLSAPSDNPSVKESDDYSEEISAFRNSINEALASPDTAHPWRNPLCRIVFAVGLECHAGACNVRPRQDVDAKEFASSRVTEGQVNFAPDIRRMPTQVGLDNDEAEDSFAVAITHAFNASFEPPASSSTETKTGDAQQSEEDEDGEFPFVLFLKEHDFEKRVLPSQTVIVSKCDDTAYRGLEDCLAVKRLVQGRVVLVGGGWHIDGENRGVLVDQYDTPAGPLTGVFVHLNYVAAALDGRIELPVLEWLEKLIDIVIVALSAVAAAASSGLWSRMKLVIMFCLFWLIAQYFTWHNLGLFIDCTIPMALLVLHSYIHETVEAQFENKRLKREVAEERAKRAAASPVPTDVPAPSTPSVPPAE